MSEWIEWRGGKQPVDGVFISLKYRDGDVIEMVEVDGPTLRWDHDGMLYDDIIAYKVHHDLDGKKLESPLSRQEGGEHYRKLKIQPIEYIQANDLGFEEGSVVKYITRHKDKNGVQDLRKAIHFIELLIAHDYPEKTE